MFAVHKTAINATQGCKTSSIHTTNLVGNFDPSQGIASTHWTNQVGGGEGEGGEEGGGVTALRRFNSITHNNSAPHNFQFDGTDDYLGEASSGYGESW